MKPPVKKKPTLEQRIKRLEQNLFPNGMPNISEICPRCKCEAYGRWQKDVCSLCAYTKGDEL